MNRLKASSRYAAAYFTAMEREHISEEKKEIEDLSLIHISEPTRP